MSDVPNPDPVPCYSSSDCLGFSCQILDLYQTRVPLVTLSANEDEVVRFFLLVLGDHHP